ncbi:hypothetical protein C8F04DRAFT_1178193 [Mycena alexandri]|uniref:Uncharacterized protein n=1 Tax=Mycena alexandri TaxID=1745969 RepID=A0AAD6XCC5_9AGAR|nr:hypothetical protein C8F04DRAFT_1178193 [Mycena alexandri]
MPTTIRFHSHEAEFASYILEDCKSGLAADRKFGRDQFSVAHLTPWFTQAFEDNLGVAQHRLELVRRRFAEMEDKEEIRQLLNKWSSEGYSFLVIEYLQERFLTPPPYSTRVTFER